MSGKTMTFETGHEEMVHDAQMDYYGKRLATASSDRTIKVFDIVNDRQTLSATLKGHDGPVWQVAWAHPKFGSLLASSSYDGRVIIWKENAPNQWIKVFEDTRHDCSVNSISFAPHTFGLCLAAACADGTVSVFTRKDNNTWDHKTFLAHKGGVNAVSWSPDVKTAALIAAGQGQVNLRAERKFVTAGCDNRIRIWKFYDAEGAWKEEAVFVNGDNAHADWVRDVSWAPSLGLPSNTIASCSEDKSVIIWSEDNQGMWRKSKHLKFDHKVWRVSFSVMGNILAVSQGDNKVSLWKESLDGEWKQLSSVTDPNQQQQQQPLSSPSASVTATTF